MSTLDCPAVLDGVDLQLEPGCLTVWKPFLTMMLRSPAGLLGPVVGVPDIHGIAEADRAVLVVPSPTVAEERHHSSEQAQVCPRPIELPSLNSAGPWLTG